MEQIHLCSIPEHHKTPKEKRFLSSILMPPGNYMNEKNISDIVVHAPYIINLGNTVKPETYELAVEFLAKEVKRAAAFHSKVLVLHPGSSLSAGVEASVEQIAKGTESGA